MATLISLIIVDDTTIEAFRDVIDVSFIEFSKLTLPFVAPNKPYCFVSMLSQHKVPRNVPILNFVPNADLDHRGCSYRFIQTDNNSVLSLHAVASAINSLLVDFSDSLDMYAQLKAVREQVLAKKITPEQLMSNLTGDMYQSIKVIGSAIVPEISSKLDVISNLAYRLDYDLKVID